MNEKMNRTYGEACNIYVRRNSLYKHSRTDLHIYNMYLPANNFEDVNEIPEWLFKKNVLGEDLLIHTVQEYF